MSEKAANDDLDDIVNSIENVSVGQDKKKKKKNKKKKGAAVQTDPPTVPVKDLFPSGQFPVGQIMDHPIAQADTTAKNRFNSEEARAIDRLQLDMYNEIRCAAEAHRWWSLPWHTKPYP